MLGQQKCEIFVCTPYTIFILVHQIITYNVIEWHRRKRIMLLMSLFEVDLIVQVTHFTCCNNLLGNLYMFYFNKNYKYEVKKISTHQVHIGIVILNNHFHENQF